MLRSKIIPGIAAVFTGLFLGLIAAAAWLVFMPVGRNSEPVMFTVPQKPEGFNTIKNLTDQGLIMNPRVFQILQNIFAKDKQIAPGGYRLNKNMNAWQVLKKIVSKPDLLWVTIPEGMRREQAGEKLAEVLGWKEDRLKEWDEAFNDKPEYKEGVYFPDTYLIPVDETGEQVAQRFVDRFNEKAAALITAFTGKDIRWTTGLKIASLIQREAAGPEDMPLISGIIWNRLDKGMKLEIDATMQYTRGKLDGNWWGPVDLAQKQADSPYNTYIYKGLPPTPICSPGLAAIEAALNPAQTDCLFYLHDAGRVIHCAATYQEHLENIREYLN